jgi:hypothetical protein
VTRQATSTRLLAKQQHGARSHAAIATHTEAADHNRGATAKLELIKKTLKEGMCEGLQIAVTLSRECNSEFLVCNTGTQKNRIITIHNSTEAISYGVLQAA